MPEGSVLPGLQLTQLPSRRLVNFSLSSRPKSLSSRAWCCGNNVSFSFPGPSWTTSTGLHAAQEALQLHHCCQEVSSQTSRNTISLINPIRRTCSLPGQVMSSAHRALRRPRPQSTVAGPPSVPISVIVPPIQANVY